MRRLILGAWFLAVSFVGCTCNDRSPSNLSQGEANDLIKAAKQDAKCSAFQIIEENGKRRLECVMRPSGDGGAAEAVAADGGIANVGSGAGNLRAADAGTP